MTLEGATVLITGASSGIGRQLARQMAPRCRRLVLVARRLDRLDALKAELMFPSLTVITMACDLSRLDDTRALCARIDAEVGEVDVLVNNAGVGDFTLFDRADWERTEQMITLDVTSLMLLTHHFVRGMVARGRGGVMNVSSGYGLGVTPAFAAYIGAKHFVAGFTEALRLDLVGTGVTVTLVCPGPVKTEFADRVGYGAAGDVVPPFAYQSDQACARQALRGFLRGRALVLTGWVMKLLYVLIMILLVFMVSCVFVTVAGMVMKVFWAGVW
jgi:short-subunit dehydrogenase